jgi:sporulation protein YlmC with PRC-barrel domain
MELSSGTQLVSITDSELTLADPEADIRGRKVVDASGEQIAEVDDLLVDEGEKKVRLVRIAWGGVMGLGQSKALIPVDAIVRITGDTVHVDRERERLAKAPAYDPALVSEQYLHDLYGYYGYTPFWNSGYVYPRYPYLV